MKLLSPCHRRQCLWASVMMALIMTTFPYSVQSEAVEGAAIQEQKQGQEISLVVQPEKQETTTNLRQRRANHRSVKRPSRSKSMRTRAKKRGPVVVVKKKATKRTRKKTTTRGRPRVKKVISRAPPPKRGRPVAVATSRTSGTRPGRPTATTTSVRGPRGSGSGGGITNYSGRPNTANTRPAVTPKRQQDGETQDYHDDDYYGAYDDDYYGAYDDDYGAYDDDYFVDDYVDDNVIDDYIADDYVADDYIVDDYVDDNVIDDYVADDYVADDYIVDDYTVDDYVVDDYVADDYIVDDYVVDDYVVDDYIGDDYIGDDYVVDDYVVDDYVVDDYVVDDYVIDDYVIDDYIVDDYVVGDDSVTPPDYDDFVPPLAGEVNDLLQAEWTSFFSPGEDTAFVKKNNAPDILPGDQWVFHGVPVYAPSGDNGFLGDFSGLCTYSNAVLDVYCVLTFGFRPAGKIAVKGPLSKLVMSAPSGAFNRYATLSWSAVPFGGTPESPEGVYFQLNMEDVMQAP